MQPTNKNHVSYKCCLYFFSLNLLLPSFLTTKDKIRVLQQNHVLIKVTMSIFLHFSPYLTLPTSNILVRVTQVLLIFEFILHLSSRYSCSIAFRFKLGSVCIEFDVESFFITQFTGSCYIARQFEWIEMLYWLF